MTEYQNGRIPQSILVHMGGEHWATPATRDRINALIADIWEHEGVRVWVTDGPNIYRDMANQVATKKHFTDLGRPQQAATPGRSGHGGTFLGRDCLAVDFSGYGPLGLTKWFSYLRKHGFQAGYYDGKNGRPYEPWHAIDWNPYSTPASASGSTSTSIKPAQPEEDEEDEMKNSGVYYLPDPKTVIYLLFNTGSGWYHEFSNGKGGGSMPSDYNNALAATLGTGSWAKVTAGHAAVIKTACDAVRRTTLAGSVHVDIADAA